MTSIRELLTQNHTHCDHLLVNCENLVSSGNWANASPDLDLFLNTINAHLEAEESILFPAIEDRAGHIGPVVIMIDEHEQMRVLLGSMREALKAKDTSAFLGASETLMMLIQQHNMKEEQILYPMAEQILGADGQGIFDKLESTIKKQ